MCAGAVGFDIHGKNECELAKGKGTGCFVGECAGLGAGSDVECGLVVEGEEAAGRGGGSKGRKD